ncbi:hypothetical protein HYC85_020406 [Camellia sinensis]|uniref:CCHC-type domain-containing protein n=1 Tax=Camellia sinensis TaxID=4442 RepID=A0A7J7GTH7_CAMSI|nr:hypothetical protein HYC85_020406 [Camellia sinensis]
MLFLQQQLHCGGMKRGEGAFPRFKNRKGTKSSLLWQPNLPNAQSSKLVGVVSIFYFFEGHCLAMDFVLHSLTRVHFLQTNFLSDLCLATIEVFFHLYMETEDLIDLPPSSNSGYKSENDNLHNSECEPSDADSHPINCELKEDKLNEEISRTSEVDVGNGDSQLFMSADIDRDLIGCSSILQASIKLNETISVAEDVKCFSSGIQSENGCVTGQDGSPISNRKRDEKTVNGSLRSYYSSGRNGTLSIALLLMIPMKSWNLVKRQSFCSGMGLKEVDASWFFNCGSYNHSLKECPKPRDNVAVNNARKQHKSRRNKNAGSRNPTRYYQNSAGGKYDGLSPGVLDAETRKLLGLGGNAMVHTLKKVCTVCKF